MSCLQDAWLHGGADEWYMGANFLFIGCVQSSEMSIQWSTRDEGEPQVQWGTRSKSYSASAEASSLTYTRHDLCDAPATTTGWIDPGFTNTATMTDLLPSTQYYYVFGQEVRYRIVLC